MKCVIEQYVMDISDFSSQYGNEGSISYVARNLVGKPSVYPQYGDFSSNFSLRTYGMWWEERSSSLDLIPGRSNFSWSAIDFVDLVYEKAVQPIQFDIYETFNPGSVIRVWGCSTENKWVLLWSGQPSLQEPSARIFTPPIKKQDLFMNKFRIEFGQQLQEYYSAFDGVALIGSIYETPPEQPLDIGSLFLKIDLPISFSEEAIILGAKFLISKDFLLFIDRKPSKDMDLPTKNPHQTLPQEAEGEEIERTSCKKLEFKTRTDDVQEWNYSYFARLPDELILHILKILDLKSLSCLSCSCKAFNKFTLDPNLYQSLSLKTCWWLLNKDCLLWLSFRCSNLRALDISWCGSYGTLSSQDFMEFINLCGRNLLILYLNNCSFIDNYCLYMVANICLSLQSISLSACQNVDHLGFCELKKLEDLTYLNLTRTKIEFRTLQIILQHVTHLTKLWLDNCTILDMDEVALTLATFTSSLELLSAWKTRGLTSRGLRALSRLKNLRDLDLGWALSGTITEGLRELLEACPNLQKIFLTALRTLTDADLYILTSYGKNLQQLDLMGTRNITPSAVLSMLTYCPCLRLLDVSYCEQITMENIDNWSLEFPHVSIKGRCLLA